MSTPLKLRCQECAYDNEPERIYCHNCGTKLDRTQLPVDAKGPETQKQVLKRVRKIVTPDRGFFSNWKKTLLNTLAWSVFVGACIQIARPPENIPAPIPDEKMGEYTNLMDVMLTMRQDGESRPVSMKEADVNRYLQNVIKQKKTGVIEEEVKFHRTYVHFHPGTVEVWTHSSFFDYPLYAGGYYQIGVQDGKITATCVGGQLGRLPVHPLVMEHLDIIFDSLWKALKGERQSVFLMANVEVLEGGIVLTNAPAEAEAPLNTPAAAPSGTPSPLGNPTLGL